MVKPVWEERWDEDGGCVDLLGDEDGHEIVIGRIGHFSSSRLLPEVVRAKLAAAAPAMARALCSIEWSESEDDLKVLQCPWCAGTDPTHASHCELDKALTQAGLDSEARETVRETEYLRDMKRLGIVVPRPRPRLRLVPQPKKEDDDEQS